MGVETAAQTGSEYAVQFQGVNKKYKGTQAHALHEIDLAIAPGEFVFLVGPSGSGKSTLLRLLLRDEKASGGRVIVNGQDLAKLRRWREPGYRRGIGTVFQDFRLLPEKSATQNVALAMEVTAKPKATIKPAVAQALELVDLTDIGKRKPRELSGGEQQRVAIARAIVNKPAILLADEPTGNLDPATSQGIVALLDRINRTGTTVIKATHDAAIVDQMRKRVIGLDGGRVRRDHATGVYRYTD